MKIINLLVFRSLSWDHVHRICCEHDLRKEIKLLVKLLLSFSIIVFNMMKLLVTLFTMKFYSKTKLNIQNSLEVFQFSVLTHDHIFGQNFVQKTQNFQFKLKFDAKTNSHTHSSLVFLTFSVFHQKYPFWQIWFSKSRSLAQAEI